MDISIFGLNNMWQRAVVERAKVVIVEFNREMPYVFGRENGVHVSEVDFIIEEIINPARSCPTRTREIDRTVAQRIAAEIEAVGHHLRVDANTSPRFRVISTYGVRTAADPDLGRDSHPWRRCAVLLCDQSRPGLGWAAPCRVDDLPQ